MQGNAPQGRSDSRWGQGVGMSVIRRSPLGLGRRRQTRTGHGGLVGTRQRSHHRRRNIVGRVQGVDPQRHTLRHIDLRAVLVGRKRMVSSVAVHALMNMQKIRVIKLHRTRMGVDERRRRLQGDEEPEHQKAVESVRHGRVQDWFWLKVKEYAAAVTGREQEQTKLQTTRILTIDS